jgi:hypothetical protein
MVEDKFGSLELLLLIAIVFFIIKLFTKKENDKNESK